MEIENLFACFRAWTNATTQARMSRSSLYYRSLRNILEFLNFLWVEKDLKP